MKSLTVALCVSAAALLLQIASAEAAAKENVLYSFCSQQNCLDGEYPWAGVTLAGDELYTTTTTGGENGNNGTMVAVNLSTGKARIAYSFESYRGDATESETDMIDLNGVLYGASAGGGLGYDQNGAGTIFSLRAGLRETNNTRILYSFCSDQNCTDGALPSSSPLHMKGIFYGTTSVGGSVAACNGPYPGCGTVYSFDPATSQETVLYNFCALQNCADGSRPVGKLVALNGIFYGVTFSGGTGENCNVFSINGCGNVFSLDPKTGVETVLHAFGGQADGGAPGAGLLYFDGMLYGTTRLGGTNSSCENPYGCGTVFSIDPVSGSETIVHSFKGGSKDGEDPSSNLIEMNGKLYGTTRGGGPHDSGTVFSVDPSSGNEKAIYMFCSLDRCDDGAYPYGGLIKLNGTLYGTTEAGGTGDQGFAIGGGTVFSITP